MFTTDPKIIQAVLATHFDSFELGPKSKNLAALLGNGIFCNDGKEWEHSRATLRPAFRRDRIINKHFDSHYRHCEKLMLALPTNDKDGWTAKVDLDSLLLQITLNFSLEFLFGISITFDIELQGIEFTT